MSAYKKLNKQDAFITTYVAHKAYKIPSSSFNEQGIEVFQSTGYYSASLKQLYYPDKIGDSILQNRYEYYSQTTLSFPQARTYSSDSKIVSIPKKLYGTNIHTDQTFKIQVETPMYVEQGYWQQGYNYLTGSSYDIFDDGEGNLYVNIGEQKEYVGDIIYSHGIAIITHPTWYTQPVQQIEFKSSHQIFTHNYHCKLREFENNYTYNPSAILHIEKTVYDNEGTIYSTTASINSGEVRSTLTGSSFTPYITTVGLYNDANELIAVGKLSTPLPKSNKTETTLIVKIDI